MTDLSEWPALVLTAGLATRLRPLSDVRAKAALPVAGTPLVVRILQWLRAAGVTRAVLNLHHRPETVTRTVGDGSRWGIEVRYSWEGKILGSAGGPRRALPLLDAERFLIVNGDTLTDCDLLALVDRHVASRALVTMALVPGDVDRYGGAIVNPDGYIAGFARARRTPPTPPALPALSASARSASPGELRRDLAEAAFGREGGPALHFIGVQAAEARAFDTVPDDEPYEIVKTLYPRLIDASPTAVAAFESRAEFLDVGTAKDYLDTVALIARREGRAFDRGDDVRVGAGSVITETVIWNRVTIGRGVHLNRCVVADNVAIPDGMHVENQVLVATEQGPQTYAL
jgi:NDP-sugar pyrophosphorylase family protein